MNRLLAASITAALATTFTGGAHAADSHVPSNVATESPRSASIDTTVLDRATIEASGATDLVELLRLQPGVDIERAGGSGHPSHVLLRGGNARQVLVLIDGARVAAAGSGEFDVSTLALDQIERIEILRGPRSAEFGSDAMGGVLRIFTREPVTGDVRIYIGRYGRRGGSASTSLGSGTRSLGLTVGGESFDGNLRAHGASVYDAFPEFVDFGSVRRNLSLVARTDVGEQQLTATARHTGGDLRINDASFGRLTSGPELLQSSNQSLSIALAGPLRPGWDHQLLLTASRDQRSRPGGPSLLGSTQQILDWLNNPATAPYVQALLDSYAHTCCDIDGRRESLDWQNRVELAAPLALRFGLHADWAADDVHSVDLATEPASTGADRNPTTSLSPSDSSRRTAASVGLAYRTDAIDAAIRLRHDHLRSDGGKTSPQLSVGWQFDPALQATVRYAEGFRAASPDERAYFPAIGFGLPDVEPEHVRTLEAGLAAALGERQRITLTAFRTRYDDLLNPQITSNYPGPGIDEARADGIELDYSCTSGPWTLDANATAQDTRGHHGVDLTGGPLPFHPRRKAAVQVAYRVEDDLRVGAELFASSPRRADLDDATTPFNTDDPFGSGRMPGYALVNLHAAWTPAPAWRIDLRVDNLADRRYSLVPNNVAPGRAWLASVRWAMD